MVFMVEMLGRGVRDAVCEFILICRSPLDDLGREEKIGPRIEPDAGPVAENMEVRHRVVDSFLKPEVRSSLGLLWLPMSPFEPTMEPLIAFLEVSLKLLSPAVLSTTPSNAFCV